ncbi:MAG: DUF1957 domain-containing protein [Firmicutes bacterium]|nr:DUF1957 domain-containing protein [Bacillota bacterium]
MTQGYLALVLHAHLPFVRHSKHPCCLEEKWLFEAINETYLPLLRVFEGWKRDGIPARVTVSLTPPLLEMLRDELLVERYSQSLNKTLELTYKELARTATNPAEHRVVRMYQELYETNRYEFHHRYNRDLVAAFARLQEAGILEIIASAATHGYLPLLAETPSAVKAQIQVGVETYRRHLAKEPVGFWLPECGFSPGLDELLFAGGLRYVILDTHGILYASPRPRYGTYAPIYCQSGLAAFGRDVESSKQVWSQQEGYPGDYDYRDFYRDIGFDLDLDYIAPYILPEGKRIHTGLKYYRITGPTQYKEYYDPERAREKAAVHAGNFVFNREHQISYLAGLMDRKPIVVAPYDMELFGHWWFEGPKWLDYVVRKTACDQKVFTLITPGDYLKIYPRNQVSTPCMSSWGWKGYHEVWLNSTNDWLYPHLYEAALRMEELARTYPRASGLLARALNQMARELLLAQSSDWAFIMKTGTVVEYAKKRFNNHINRFNGLYQQIKEDRLEEDWLSELEATDNIFGTLNYQFYG